MEKAVLSRGAEEQRSRGAEEQRSRGAEEQRSRGAETQYAKFWHASFCSNAAARIWRIVSLLKTAFSCRSKINRDVSLFISFDLRPGA